MIHRTASPVRRAVGSKKLTSTVDLPVTQHVIDLRDPLGNRAFKVIDFVCPSPKYTHHLPVLFAESIQGSNQLRWVDAHHPLQVEIRCDSCLILRKSYVESQIFPFLHELSFLVWKK